jgi:predicted DNA-binding protein
METVKLTVLVPADLRRRAKAEAAMQGISLSEIVRNGLEEFLEDAEDIAVALETLKQIKQGNERTYSHEEVWV